MIKDRAARPLGVLAFIPILSSDREFGKRGLPRLCGRSLLRYTIDAAREAACVDRTVVSTDHAAIAKAAREMGAEVPFLRTGALADRSKPVTDAVTATLEWLSAHQQWQPDLVVFLEITHPLRKPGLIDQVVGALVQEDLDTVFAAREERHAYWTYGTSGGLERVGSDEARPRESKTPLYRELDGLAMACRVSVLLRGRRHGDRIGVVPVRDLSSLVDLHDPDGFELAERLLSRKPKAAR